MSTYIYFLIIRTITSSIYFSRRGMRKREREIGEKQACLRAESLVRLLCWRFMKERANQRNKKNLVESTTRETCGFNQDLVLIFPE